jgi:sulfite reductase alpha subunit-like flavoprotein
MLLTEIRADIFLSIDGAFLPWSVSLRSHLLSEYPLPEGLSPISPDLPLPPKIILERDLVIDKMGGKLGAAIVLDSKAAQFSHIDAVDAVKDEAALRIEREQPYHNIRFSRLSERTASEIRGGIDYLDRPNVLRDHPEKYSVTDPKPLHTTLPPEDLLPIPDHWTATVEKNERLTPMDHWQDVRHLVLRLHPRLIKQQQPARGKEDKPNLDSLMYEAGDALKLYPKNFPEDVQQLIDLMEWNAIADEPFKHYSERKDGIAFEHAPRRCYPMKNSTLRQLLTNNYDITAIPKRTFFDHAKFFAEDPMHKERLAEFADPRFTDEFYDYTSRPRRSILEVLQEFSSVKIPYQYVPLMFPPICAREYSIASHGGLMLDEDHPQDTLIELVIAVVKYKTVLRKTRRGLCSRYVESLEPGTKINVTHAEHSVPPSDGPAVRRPFIAVCAGTGIAPIRAFFHDRAATVERGPQILFFGARNRHADFFFEEEWQDLGVKVFPAFSRDQREKVYVQDVIRREYQVICSFVQKRALICICGSAGKMPVAVREAFLDAMIKGGLATDHATAAKFVAENCTVWEETW